MSAIYTILGIIGTVAFSGGTIAAINRVPDAGSVVR